MIQEQIWRLWARWQNKVWDGIIDYPDNFNVHDKENTIHLLKVAKETMPQNPELLKQIDIMLAEALITDEDILEKVKEDQQTIQPEGVPNAESGNEEV